MVNASFGVVPLGIPGTPIPFTLHVPDADINQFTHLVETAVIGAPSFYNTHNTTDGPDFAFGTTRDWFAHAASVWHNDFDWRSHERYYNTFPQFTISVTAPSDNQTFNLHFAALFSQNPEAVPVIFSHGWPSSWLDYLPLFELLAAKYTPATLPYHIVTPSIPDFGLSTRSNLTTTELTFSTAAEALNSLMVSLGFTSYVAQGGDVGSGITAALGAAHEECKAVHFNNFALTPSERASVAHLPVTAEEKATLKAAEGYLYGGTGYMLEQGTKPGAISLVLMTNPMALLGWIGSMYAEGTTFSLDAILQQVSWYWYTKSYGRSLWAYRGVWQGILRDKPEGLPSPLVITDKPLGFSWYPGEVLTVAKSWMEHWFPENLVQYRAHKSGGHFASLDDPKGYLEDIEEFVTIVKTKIKF